AVAKLNRFRWNSFLLQPILNDSTSCLIVATRRILFRIGVGSQLAAFFTYSAQQQLSKQVVALFICFGNYFGGPFAVLVTKFGWFLRVEFFLFSYPKGATSNFRGNLDAAGG